jgi:hypothetical protein
VYNGHLQPFRAEWLYVQYASPALTLVISLFCPECYYVFHMSLRMNIYYFCNYYRSTGPYNRNIISCDVGIGISKFYLRKSCFKKKLTPRGRALVEKLIFIQLVKSFPFFHGTRSFITVNTSIFRDLKRCSQVSQWLQRTDQLS